MIPDVPNLAKRACQKTLWGPRVTSWQCFRKGVAQERELFGGKPRGKPKWWCRQHLPSNELSRRDERDARIRTEIAAAERKYARQDAERDLMSWAREQLAGELPAAAQKIVDEYERNVEDGDVV